MTSCRAAVGERFLARRRMIRTKLSAIRFNLVAHYRQGVMATSAYSDDSMRVWDELERLLEARRLPSRAVSALSDAAFGYRVRNSSYSQQAGRSEHVGNQDLSKPLSKRACSSLKEKREEGSILQLP